jgi:peroxiredoxin
MFIAALAFALVGCAEFDLSPAEAVAGEVQAVADDVTPAPEGPAALGAMAPGFALTDLDGVAVRLDDLRGKTVVLEWFNPGCPFVKYAHGEDGPLRDLPAEAIEEGVVWLAINSGGPGKQGHGLETNQESRAEWDMDYPVLLDESGETGQRYDARTTPHMYVIDPAGVLVYAGALDNQPLGRLKGDAPTNFVTEALADLSAGDAVGTPETKAYGCSVKYGS